MKFLPSSKRTHYHYVHENDRKQIVDRAKKQVGWPYVIGGRTSRGIDCSGSVMEAWAPEFTFREHLAADMAAGSGGLIQVFQAFREESIMKNGMSVENHMLPGDVFFYYGDMRFPNTIHHVAVYIGGGRVVNATGTGIGVEIIKIDQYVKHCGVGLIGHRL